MPEAPNRAQAEAWDGPEGDTWTDHEDFYNTAIRAQTPVLLAAAAISPSDRVLDIGCGTGETTRLAARAARDGHAVGIDLSSRMLERALERAREQGITNVTFEHGDAQVASFPAGDFDVVISRYGNSFFDDPVAAYRNIPRALTPGGRLAMLCWRELSRNEWISCIREALAAGRDLPEPPPGMPSPFALAQVEHVHAVLDRSGFTDVNVDPFDSTLYMGPDAASAIAAIQNMGVVQGLLAELDERARIDALDALRRTLEDHETPEGVLFGSSSWLVRAATAR